MVGIRFGGGPDEILTSCIITPPYSVPSCIILSLQVAAQTETVKEIADDQVWFLLIKLIWQIFQYCSCGGSAQTSSIIK